MKKVSIITPLYFKELEKYPILDAFYDTYTMYKKPNFELIVIDDCSPLDHDFYVTFKKPCNTGFTETVNEGFKRATGEILVMASDDIEFNSKIMDKIETIKDNEVCLPTWVGEPVSDDNKFGFFWGMTRKTFYKLGKMDESMTQYFSDLDYNTRAKEKCIKIVKWWDTPVLHHGGATLKNNPQDYLRDMAVYKNKYGRID